MRSAVIRGTGGFIAITIAVAIYSACGLQVSGAADTGATDGGTTSEASLPPPPPRPDGDGGLLESDAQAPQPCSTSEVTCNGVCSNLQTDSENCGQCGRVCEAGQACEAGNCAVICQNETVRCGASCVSTATDALHCGGCDKPCAPPNILCSQGTCVPACEINATLCNVAGASYCANLTNDPNNCGGCGTKCTANQICSNSGCQTICATGSTVGDVFGPTMYGCTGKVSYTNRDDLCGPGLEVCSAAEYVQRRAGKKPTYNYWTNTNLGYYGNSQTCLVDTSQVNGCTHPMRVCTASQDPLGNRCNWTNCGYKNYTPNEYFGGCSGDTTAGTLCCP